ncbi:hypothetical protein CYK57_00419 [Actinobacillus pleuropneumoniae]|nr:hypothetical protein CYK57_00419 [Actinobacillus pleuropneumoniae]
MLSVINNKNAVVYSLAALSVKRFFLDENLQIHTRIRPLEA